VEGVRVRECLLETGNRLQIGRCELLFRWTSAPIEIPLSPLGVFGDAIGETVSMRELFALLARAASTDAPVVLVGETGAGKEILAAGIHRYSSRKGPFDVLDCGALAPSLVESELFGHERGAFTGAVEARAGAFERAHRGTILLDEIGELPLQLQPKLLRVLETGQVRRLGGNRAIEVDVRVVAATHRDLDAMVARGSFRADLYHRIAVITARIPPLRERVADIPLLTTHFLRHTRYLHDVPVYAVKNFVAVALSFLSAYTWPGNVRELRNVVERAAILADPAKIEADAVTRLAAVHGELILADRIGRLPMRTAVEQFEREYLTELLRTAGRRVATAAQIAQIHPKSLARLLRKHGIHAGDA
jgi:DNA-binding NtrC family response regulator